MVVYTYGVYSSRATNYLVPLATKVDINTVRMKWGDVDYGNITIKLLKSMRKDTVKVGIYSLITLIDVKQLQNVDWNQE